MTPAYHTRSSSQYTRTRCPSLPTRPSRQTRLTSFKVFAILSFFFDCKTSMITDEDLLRGLSLYWDLSCSLTLHVPEEMRRRCERPAHAPQPSDAFDHFRSICQLTHSDWSNTVMAGATFGLPADGDLINPCS